MSRPPALRGRSPDIHAVARERGCNTTHASVNAQSTYSKPQLHGISRGNSGSMFGGGVSDL